MLCTTGTLVVMGEISTDCYVDIASVARKVVNEIGYDRPDAGFDGHTCGVMTAIDEQSPDIALGVDKSFELKAGEKDELNLHGAGDQGLMFGYATNETEEYMPLTLVLSHKLCRRLAEVRKDGTLPWLRPDGKSQVTVEYDDGKPARVDTVVVSTQHSEDVSLEEIRKSVTDLIIKEVVPEELMDKDTKIYINPTGRFTVGGPCGDTGLTGRKIIVDTYGGAAHHGGGCFSGRTPQRSTVRQHMRRVGLPKMSLLRVLPISAKFSLPMQSAWRNRCRLWLTPSARENTATKKSPRRWKRCLICALRP